MAKIDLQKINSNLQTVQFYFDKYPDRQFPKPVLSQIQQLLKEADGALHPNQELPPNSTPLTGKSSYFSMPTLRAVEISGSYGALNREGSYAYLLTVIDEELKKTPQNFALILLKELLLQSPQLLDARALSIVQEAYRKAFDSHRQTLYSSMITKDWQRILENYEATGEFFIDCDTFKVYPIVLDPFTGLESKKFSVRPLPEPNMARVFDIEEEKLSKQTEAEINTNPHMHISVGNLHSMGWRLDCYSDKVESLYSSFKEDLNLRLEDFKRKHGGGLTPELILEKDGTIYKLLSDQVKLGYRIQIQQPETKEDKKPSLKQKLNQIVKG